MKDPNHLCLGCMGEWGRPDAPCPVCGFVEKAYDKPPRWLSLKYVLNGKYMVGKVIGEGGFGITYLGWDLNLQIRVAVKEYFPIGLATRETGRGNGNTISALPGVRQENYRQGLEKFMSEAKNLSKFYHLQGIVTVKDFFFENETAYMVMEFIDGITLGKYLKNHGGQISEQDALQLFYPVTESLRIVHQSGIIHRDISPDNIMMTKDGQMKLIDFGAARFAGGDTERSLTIILKHGYAPVEQYQSHGNQGPWTDVYAICATMYRMITGKVPPGAMDRLHQDTLEEFEQLGFRVSAKTAYALIDKGLAIRAEDRYKDMDELIQGLYGMDQKKVYRKKRVNEQKKALGIAVVACAVCLTIGGMILAVRALDRNNQPADNGQPGNTQAGNASSDSQVGTGQSSQDPPASEREFVQVSADELKALQAEAIEAAKRISADAYHLVSLRDDGSSAASGTNDYGHLDVTGWKEIKAIATGDSHTVGVKEDGSAVAAGDTSYGKCAVDTWKGIIKVSAGNGHTLGLKEDGAVSAAGSNHAKQCDVSAWTDIIDIAAGGEHSLGLKADGTVVAAGDEYAEQCQVGEWRDIVQIDANDHISAGLKSDGTVVITGQDERYKEALEWKQVISVQLGDGYIAGILSDKTVVVTGSDIVTQEKIDSWSDIAAIALADETIFGKKTDGGIVRTSHSYGTVEKDGMTDLKKVVSGGGYLVGLKNDGSVVSWGVSGTDFGLSEVSGWSALVDAAACEDGVLGLKADGSVVAIGEKYKEAESWSGITGIVMGKDAAIGIKADGSCETVGESVVHDEAIRWEGISAAAVSSDGERLAALHTEGTVTCHGWDTGDIQAAADIAIGPNHMAAVLSDGSVTVVGSNVYTNVYGWQDVIQVAVGAEHTIGLKSDGTLLAAGDNSSGQCNISGWADVIDIAAGEYFTLGIKSDGSMLIAGKLPGEF